MIYAKSNLRNLVLLFALAVLAAGPKAHATRVVNFSAQGQNVLGQTNGKTYLVTGSTLRSGCNVTIINNSSQRQNITYYIKLTSSNGSYSWNSGASGTAATLGAVSTASSPGTDCTSASPYCTIPSAANSEFPTYTTSVAPGTNINGGSQLIHSVSCEGWIRVDDTTSTALGFVTASGALTTYVESPPAGLIGSNSSARRSTTTPTVTPIVIGEGRPF